MTTITRTTPYDILPSVKKFMKLSKLKTGDKVAIVAPSSGLAAVFPWVYKLGLERIRNEIGLETIEYPSTKLKNASLEARAKDLMDAFADPDIKAIISTIGGSDQIRLLKYLSPETLRANPKLFFGYSDNTHLGIYLWNLGIPSYYGGSVMTQFAMQSSMDEMTISSLREALFTDSTVPIIASETYNDIGLTWQDESNLTKKRLHQPNAGWSWDGEKDAEGVLWGGCVESLVAQFSTSIYLPNDDDITGAALFLETGEDIPEHWIIEYLLTGMGERGWLNKFSAVLIGRPKAWEYNKQNSDPVKEKYRQDQQTTVLRTIRMYNSEIPVVQNMDFGHTDPQTILPVGNKVFISSKNHQINLQY